MDTLFELSYHLSNDNIKKLGFLSFRNLLFLQHCKNNIKKFHNCLNNKIDNLNFSKYNKFNWYFYYYLNLLIKLKFDHKIHNNKLDLYNNKISEIPNYLLLIRDKTWI